MPGPQPGAGKLNGPGSTEAVRWLASINELAEDDGAADRPARTTNMANTRRASFIGGSYAVEWGDDLPGESIQRSVVLSTLGRMKGDRLQEMAAPA